MTKSKALLPNDAYDKIPRVTLTLTDETIWLTRHDPRGAAVATYPVSAAHVSTAFNTFGASTGLLPEHTLFWQSQGGRARVGLWLPPATRTIIFTTGRGDERLTLPLPGLILVGHGVEYWIYAARRYPRSGSEPLYHAPLPNVHGDGKICQGNVQFPKCEAYTIAQAARLFFESAFNHDLSTGKLLHEQGSLLNFLRSLQGKHSFPLDQLVPTETTMEDLVYGKRASRRRAAPTVDEDDPGGGEFRFDDDVWSNDDGEVEIAA